MSTSRTQDFLHRPILGFPIVVWLIIATFVLALAGILGGCVVALWVDLEGGIILAVSTVTVALAALLWLSIAGAGWWE